MRWVVSLVGVLAVAMGVYTTAAQESSPTPAIVPAQASPEAGYCSQVRQWTPIAGLELTGSIWSIIVDEVRVEDVAIVDISGTQLVSESLPGSDYVTVLMTATNVSTDVQGFSPITDLRLFDSQGKTYRVENSLVAPWILKLNIPLTSWEPNGTYPLVTAYLLPTGEIPSGIVSSDGSLCLEFSTLGTPTPR